MASPATVASGGTGMSAAGGAFGFFGNLLKGKGESDMYKYKSAIAQLNAEQAQKNEEYALVSGEQQAMMQGMKTRAVQGATRAAKGAGNIAINSGSAADVLAGEKAIGDIDTATTRNNASRVAYGYAYDAASQTMQSQMYTKAASNSMLAGEIGAFGSLVSGATSVSSKWMQGKSVFG